MKKAHKQMRARAKPKSSRRIVTKFQELLRTNEHPTVVNARMVIEITTVATQP